MIWEKKEENSKREILDLKFSEMFRQEYVISSIVTGNEGKYTYVEAG